MSTAAHRKFRIPDHMVVPEAKPGESLEAYAARVIAEIDRVPVEEVTFGYIRERLEFLRQRSTPVCSTKTRHSSDEATPSGAHVHDVASTAALG